MRKARLLPTLVGLAACAHAGGLPAPAPVPPEPAPAPAVAAAPAPTIAPPARADSGPVAAPPSPITRITSPTSAAPAPRDTIAQDTTAEEAFLDTLQTMSFDSTAPGGAAAPAKAERTEPDPPAPSAGAPAGAAQADATAVGRGPMFDIEVANYAANERVQYYLDYFRGRARNHFALYLARLGRWDAMLRSKLRAARLPQDLKYMAMIESGLNPNAVSRRRAVGMWQFIAWTGRRYGLTVDPWVDERRDPWLATDAAIRMISELNDRFGSLYLAAAAYDAGPGKIQRGLNRFDLSDHEGNDLFFALADERFLRRETRDYVPKIIAAAMIAKEPAKWGFQGIEPWSPLTYDSIRVTDAVGLDVLARLADTTQEAMGELNPQLIRRATPPGRTVWVRVPVGTADSTRARLAVLPPERRITHREHFVSRGETLGAIALRYRVSVDDILAANRGVRPRSLRIGQRLVIPMPGTRPASVASARPRRAASRQYLLSTAGRLPASGQPRVHVVRRGESAWAIARRYRIDVGELLRVNGLTKDSVIKPGQTLRIPG
jgi:membrane-bound lytic murein transglycosylase D